MLSIGSHLPDDCVLLAVAVDTGSAGQPGQLFLPGLAAFRIQQIAVKLRPAIGGISLHGMDEGDAASLRSVEIGRRDDCFLLFHLGYGKGGKLIMVKRHCALQQTKTPYANGPIQ